MKHFAPILFLFLSASFFFSCEYESTTPNYPWGGIVSGKVIMNGKSLNEVYISIDSNPLWVDTTDAFGGFQISGVSKYEHYVTVRKNLDSGRFIYLYQMIQMDNDGVNMRTLEFDAPSDLWVSDTIINNVSRKILSWNKAKQEIVDYKIYKQNVPNIGMGSVNHLIAVIESREDTTLIDDDIAAGPFYYKVLTYYPVFYKSDLKIIGSKEVYK